MIFIVRKVSPRQRENSRLSLSPLTFPPLKAGDILKNSGISFRFPGTESPFSLLIVLFITILFHASPFIKNAPTWRIILWNMHALRPLPEGGPLRYPSAGVYCETDFPLSRMGGVRPYRKEHTPERYGRFLCSPLPGNTEDLPFSGTKSVPPHFCSFRAAPPSSGNPQGAVPGRNPCPASCLFKNIPERSRASPAASALHVFAAKGTKKTGTRPVFFCFEAGIYSATGS